MLYREIIAVCSQIHTKHIHTACVGGSVLVTAELNQIVCREFCANMQEKAENFIPLRNTTLEGSFETSATDYPAKRRRAWKNDVSTVPLRKA